MTLLGIARGHLTQMKRVAAALIAARSFRPFGRLSAGIGFDNRVLRYGHFSFIPGNIVRAVSSALSLPMAANAAGERAGC